MNELSLDFRSRSTPKQFTALLEFMESRGDIGKPLPGVQRRIKADGLWQELADLLNCMGGPVRSIEKWKKVWADWKAKTKKKAILIRRDLRAGGPSKHTLTGLERRVLRVMGLAGAVPQNPKPEESPSPPSSPPPSPPPSPSEPQGHRVFLAPPTAQTPAEEAMYGFVSVEHRRLQLEEIREQNQHEREMERLRLESRRIEIEVNNNQTLCRLAEVLSDLTGILSNLKPLSLPSTNTF